MQLKQQNEGDAANQSSTAMKLLPHLVVQLAQRGAALHSAGFAKQSDVSACDATLAVGPQLRQLVGLQARRQWVGRAPTIVFYCLPSLHSGLYLGGDSAPVWRHAD